MGNTIGVSYENLNQIYPDSIKVSVDEHEAYIGGVSKPWSDLNDMKISGNEMPPQHIVDSVLFANFLSPVAKNMNYKESPWKIHLSIHPEDLGKAWNIVYPILLKVQVPNFKVSRLLISKILLQGMERTTDEFLLGHHLLKQDKVQAIQDILRVHHGMQITIYIPEEKEKEYNKLVEEIESSLLEAGIRPGIVDKSDRLIGFYSSVRHVGKNYTTHDKVSGYKSVLEKDPFKATKPRKNEMTIPLEGLDYPRHTIKARDTLQQVIDAKRTYDLGMIDKRELAQICDVAEEFFIRWHHFLKKASEKSLKGRELVNFQKFKQWIDYGYQLTPSIKGNKSKKIKEAEDLLLHSSKIDLLSNITRPPLQRKNGVRNLRVGFLSVNSEPEFAETKPVELAVDDTAKILRKLQWHRHNSFKSLSKKTLPNIKETPQVTIESTTLPAPDILKQSDPVEGRGEEISNNLLSSDVKKSSISIGGSLIGGLAGLLGGIALGIIFWPLFINIAVPFAVVLSGIVIGSVSGFLLSSWCDNSDVQKEERIPLDNKTSTPEQPGIESGPQHQMTQSRLSSQKKGVGSGKNIYQKLFPTVEDKIDEPLLTEGYSKGIMH